MELIYLLNRNFAPYYKWMFKGLEQIDDFDLAQKLNQLVFIPIMNIEENESFMEHICVLLLEKMEKKGFLTRNPHTTYLEHYIGQVLNYAARKENGRTKDNSDFKENIKAKENNLEMGKTENMNMEDHKKELVDKLIRLEWQNFDQVKNEGGRADCQDDWGTFSIMRTSQYLTWTEEMLQSYIQDFEEAMAKGWNLITEKYGRMMESTAPDRFDEIKDQFPYLAEEKKTIIDEIVKIQVAWMEEFAAEYP